MKKKFINEEVFKYISIKVSAVLYILMLFPFMYMIWKYNKTITDLFYQYMIFNILFILIVSASIYIEMIFRNKGEKMKFFLDEKDLDEVEISSDK